MEQKVEYLQRCGGGKEVGVMNSPWGLEWKERGGEWLPVVGLDSNLISLLRGTGSAHPPCLLIAPGLPRSLLGGALYHPSERWNLALQEAHSQHVLFSV